VGREPVALVLLMVGPQAEDLSLTDTEKTRQLLKQAKAGDAAAFEQIILVHQRLVLMTALRLLGELRDAQDAAQEVFLRLYKYLHHR
jgi:RNA polymerase sigma-70 factor, ECF subfamily